LFVPPKADAPLVIYSNTVLTSAAALERLEAVSWWQTHNIKPIGGVELEKFSTGCALNVGWQTA
jgi:hypothetical protein